MLGAMLKEENENILSVCDHVTLELIAC